VLKIRNWKEKIRKIKLKKKKNKQKLENKDSRRGHRQSVMYISVYLSQLTVEGIWNNSDFDSGSTEDKSTPKLLKLIRLISRTQSVYLSVSNPRTGFPA